MRVTGGVAGLLGGSALVVSTVLESDALWWGGAAAAVMGCAVAGAALVSSSAVALRLFVAVAFPVLVVCMWWVARDSADRSDPETSAVAVSPDVVDGTTGGLVGLGGVVALARRRRPEPAAPGRAHRAPRTARE